MLGSFDDSRREKKICHEFNPLVQIVQFVQYVCSMGVKSAHEAGLGDSFIFLERESTFFLFRAQALSVRQLSGYEARD